MHEEPRGPGRADGALARVEELERRVAELERGAERARRSARRNRLLLLCAGALYVLFLSWELTSLV